MTFPEVTAAEWRAQVEKDLAGAAFEKALVETTPEGVAVQPLYTDVPPSETGWPGSPPFTRGSTGSPAPFRVCMRHDVPDLAAIADDLDGGAEALWMRTQVDDLFGHAGARQTYFVVDGEEAPLAHLSALMEGAARRAVPTTGLRFALRNDPLGRVARGLAKEADLADFARAAKVVGERYPLGRGALLSTLAYHAAGADAADELAFALSTGVAYLGALLDGGLTVGDAAHHLGVQVAVGHDTFAELAKLRALRLCWGKLLTAAGAPEAPLPLLHAVCSPRTLTTRDPWVNLLRVSTQVFAAVLGGADLVTPASYDQALGEPGALGRRVARNTCLVLREESHLGRVVDPAGGAYYVEHLTEALARAAWRRFRELEKAGGIAKALADGSLRARLDAAWKKRRHEIARRRVPITGVSEFANLDEAPLGRGDAVAVPEGALPAHRDAEDFEALRDRSDALAAEGALPAVSLVALGPASEHRARLGFAGAFFAAGGLRAREATASEPATVACLCGSDDRYLVEAAATARVLKAAGCRKVLLAGRPGSIETELREAGVDGFLYMGCDVVAVLSDVMGGRS